MNEDIKDFVWVVIVLVLMLVWRNWEQKTPPPPKPKDFYLTLQDYRSLPCAERRLQLYKDPLKWDYRPRSLGAPVVFRGYGPQKVTRQEYLFTQKLKRHDE